MARSIDVQFAVDRSETPAISVGNVGAVDDVLGCGEDWVAVHGVVCEWDAGVGVGLPVCGFGLDLAHEVVFGVDEGVLVKCVVFDGGSP